MYPSLLDSVRKTCCSNGGIHVTNLSFSHGTFRIELLSLMWLDIGVSSYIFLFIYPDLGFMSVPESNGACISSFWNTPTPIFKYQSLLLFS